MPKNSDSLLFIIIGIISLVIISGNPVFAENYTVTIPLGASNPNFDTPAREWFSPSVISINAGDSITWLNQDNEIHTIFSGKGIDRIGFATGKSAVSDGIFSSDSFKPGQSWSHTFDKAGTFHYFCDIHPWMNGVVVVNEAIPDIATDSSGNQITKWPIGQYTQQKEYESDMSWEPHVILTGQQEIFVFQFYNPETSQTLRGTSYEFVIFQNGKELQRVSGQTDIGGDYKYFVFKDSGPATFRLENIGGNGLSTEFSTIVYKNPNETSMNMPMIQPARNIIFGQEILFILIGPPIGIMIFTVLYAKGVFSKKSSTKGKEHDQKRTPV